MVGNYSVGEPNKIDGELVLDICSLNATGKEYKMLNLAYSKKIPVHCTPSKGIQEIFLNLTLQVLRDIDGDEDKQTEYLKSKIFSLNSNRFNIFVMRLTLSEHDELKHEDIEYIHDLLCHPYNDILIPPLIDFTGDTSLDKEKRIEVYENLFKQFIEIKNNTQDIKLGMLIPVNYPAKQIKRIFEYYSDENKQPDFFLLDFGGRRLPDKYTRLPRLKRELKQYLDDPEKRFVYGFNVKPWKRAKESSLSEEIRAFMCGIHAIGPVRGKKRFIPPIDDPYLRLPKIFKKEDYNYHRLNEQLYKSNVSNWINETFNREIEINLKTNSAYFNAYNIAQVNAEGHFFTQNILEGDEQTILNSLKRKPNIVFEELTKDNAKTMK